MILGLFACLIMLLRLFLCVRCVVACLLICWFTRCVVIYAFVAICLFVILLVILVVGCYGSWLVLCLAFGSLVVLLVCRAATL